MVGTSAADCRMEISCRLVAGKHEVELPEAVYGVTTNGTIVLFADRMVMIVVCAEPHGAVRCGADIWFG